MKLPIAAFDAETPAIRFPHPLIGRRPKAPIGVHQLLTAMSTPLSPVVTALDTDRDRGLALLGIGQGISTPTAPFPSEKDPCSARSLGMLGLASPTDHRYQKGIACRLQIADDVDTVKPAVEQQIAGFDAGFRSLLEQAVDHVVEGIALPNVGQTQGEALALAHDIDGGIGVKMAGPLLGLAPIDFVGIVQRLSVVGDEHQVEVQRLAMSAQGFG